MDNEKNIEEIKKIDSELLDDAISVKDASMFLWHLEKSVNGTMIQWHRIQKAKRALPGPGPGVSKSLILTLFLDIHFYFISYDKAQNLFECICKTSHNLKLCDLWEKSKSSFKKFNDARNHLEHIETRTKKKYRQDFGNVHNDTFAFGGEKFDISYKGLEFLIDAYKQLIEIVK